MLQQVKRLGMASTLAGALFFTGLIPAAAFGQAPDNTAANRGQDETADQQKNNKTDRAITQQIRKAIVADKSLSTYAHNVKIITRNGSVTLRGPVRSEDEKAAIESKAKAVTGVGAVQNEITVAPKTTKSQG